MNWRKERSGKLSTEMGQGWEGQPGRERKSLKDIHRWTQNPRFINSLPQTLTLIKKKCWETRYLNGIDSSRVSIFCFLYFRIILQLRTICLKRPTKVFFFVAFSLLRECLEISILMASISVVTLPILMM